MSENHAAVGTLFDLLARAWNLENDVEHLVFSHDDKAVLFVSSSGQLALASNQDAESPKARTRVEVDTGRTTIRQRKNPIPSLRFASVATDRSISVVPYGPHGFMAIDTEGTLHQVTAKGECIAMSSTKDAPITTICSSKTGDMLAIGRETEITVCRTSDLDIMIHISLDHPVRCMAISADSQSLACWGADTLKIFSLNVPGDTPLTIQGISDVTAIDWEISGYHIACASSRNFFTIVDTKIGSFQTIQNYPDKVSVAVFSEKGNALVTSGAYRVAGWSNDDLPMNDQPGTPLTTGKSGLVIVNTIAAHPSRSLVAVGYTNGLVTISSIGNAQEMMVHQENNAKVNTLSWSNTGEHLAIGFTSGKAAVITFPDQLFK